VSGPRRVVSVTLPTPYGEFEAHAFECSSRFVYLALAKGAVHGSGTLTRLHSECLTGDVLGSLRCDCGVQLHLALRIIGAEGRGVLIYVTGHEGRGIGLVNKLRAYREQEYGADTVEANLRLGLPVDCRQYGDAAAVLKALGVRSVRLLTNNPEKGKGLRAAGLQVERLEPLPTAAHTRNSTYLRAKAQQLGHRQPAGEPIKNGLHVTDVSRLLGAVQPRPDRPYVVLKYAQTLDGRIATASGDSKWISGQAERQISHALRAACDAVLVGVGTVMQDDPQLTVRLVPGASPLRVVLDSTLRIPSAARILDADAATLLVTTDRSCSQRRQALRTRHLAVHVVPAGPGGVDITVALRLLRTLGICSLLVEGGAKVLTSILAAGHADRIIVGVAPKIIGAGTESVGDLGIRRVAAGVRLTNRCLHVMADDLLVAWDIEHTQSSATSRGVSAGS
jgi:GTP cyclohydrolase II